MVEYVHQHRLCGCELRHHQPQRGGKRQTGREQRQHERFFPRTGQQRAGADDRRGDCHLQLPVCAGHCQRRRGAQDSLCLYRLSDERSHLPPAAEGRGTMGKLRQGKPGRFLCLQRFGIPAEGTELSRPAGGLCGGREDRPERRLQQVQLYQQRHPQRSIGDH